MISEIILGTFIPVILLYQIPFVSNYIQTIQSNLNIVCTTYLSILNNIQNENKNNLCVQLIAPVYAIYKLCFHAFYLAISYLEYQNNKNITFFENHYCIQYTLHNKLYFILIDKKESSTNQIYKVMGSKCISEKDVNNLDQFITSCSEENTSCNEENDNENTSCNEEYNEENTSCNDEYNEEYNEENTSYNDENDNEDTISEYEDTDTDTEDEDEDTVVEDKDSYDENTNDEDEDEDKDTVVEDRDSYDENTYDEDEDDIPLLDITDYFFSCYGPSKNFHNSVITPKLLGFNKIIIYYLDGINFEECQVTFVDDNVIQI